jgi:hypothetical protein
MLSREFCFSMQYVSGNEYGVKDWSLLSLDCELRDET